MNAIGIDLGTTTLSAVALDARGVILEAVTLPHGACIPDARAWAKLLHADVLYDKAVLEPVRAIDDEAIWGIVGQKEDDRKRLESQRFGSSQVMRYIERMKQETKTDFSGESK